VHLQDIGNVGMAVLCLPHALSAALWADSPATLFLIPGHLCGTRCDALGRSCEVEKVRVGTGVPGSLMLD
jgi:hypothetical protein